MKRREQELIERIALVKENLAQAAIESGRSIQDVTLVAVSKLHPAADIQALAENGHIDFGENYVQEALEKQEVLTETALRWHFIGGLQSNKAKFVAGRFGLIHSVDSEKLAQGLQKKAQSLNAIQEILLQVNIAGEVQKSGISIESLNELADTVMNMKNLRLVGLMTMPPFFDAPEKARPIFARLRQLRDALEDQTGVALPHLSMGMTGDYIPAVQEGATLVRIGTQIFGARPPKV